MLMRAVMRHEAPMLHVERFAMLQHTRVAARSAGMACLML